MSNLNFNNLDVAINYHDKLYDSDATFTLKEAKKSPFLKEFEDMFNEFNESCGEIKSVTYIFKDNDG